MSLQTAAGRRLLYRYWVRDPLIGARLVVTHELLRLLPTSLVSRIGADLARLFAPKLHPQVDERARAALRILRPDLALDEQALDASMQRLWSSLGKVYAEFSAEDRFWSEGRVRVEGEEHLRLIKERGQPLLVAGVHLGNWEILPITLVYLGHRIIDVYQPQRNRFEDRIAMRARLRIAERIRTSVPSFQGLSVDELLRLVPPTPGAGAELLHGLKDGRALMMFVDESAAGRVFAPRFGRMARQDGNMGRIVRLARMVGGAVVPAYVKRDPDDARFTVNFLPPISLASTDNAKADVAENIERLDAVLAPLILENIEQWYMMIDYRHDR